MRRSAPWARFGGFWVGLSLLFGPAYGRASEPQSLSLGQLEGLKKKPCALVQLWAAWCSICIEEMPQLLDWYAQNKSVTPVIIDISIPQVQEKFGKQWNVLKRAAFATYFKPAGNESGFLAAVDRGWKGTLPHYVLYRKGKLVRRWSGQQPIAAFQADVLKACR